VSNQFETVSPPVSAVVEKGLDSVGHVACVFDEKELGRAVEGLDGGGLPGPRPI
jgi:hypothetical protein